MVVVRAFVILLTLIGFSKGIEKQQTLFLPIKDIDDFKGLIENVITYSPIIADSILMETSGIGIDSPSLNVIEDIIESESKKVSESVSKKIEEEQARRLEEERETPEFFFFYGVQAYLSKTVSAYYVPVGFTSDEILNLKVVIKFPYIVRKVKRKGKEYKNSGFGDTAIYLNRFFYLFKNHVVLIPSVFIKFPTGEHKVIKKVDVSTGTGSIDYGGGITGVLIAGANMFILAFSYTVTGTYDPPESKKINYGDVISSSVSYQRGFGRKRKLWVGTKLSYLRLFESRIGDKDAKDNMTLIDITPYLRVRIDSDVTFIGHRFFFNIGMTIPIVTKFNPDLRVPEASRDPIFSIGFSSIF